MKKFILFIICVLSFFIFVNSAAMAENIRFVQISDSHLTVGSEYSKKVLKSAVDDINKQDDISFVVFTGDNINNPKEENLRTFVSIASKLHVPYYVALGNCPGKSTENIPQALPIVRLFAYICSISGRPGACSVPGSDMCKRY